MNPKLNYLAHIDGLRALAVWSVLFFHLDLTYFSGGFVGVDIFFVISGFLISRLIISELQKTGHFHFKNFYIRRIRRIIPAYFLILILTSILATIILSTNHKAIYGQSLASAVLSVSNILFWYEADYFDVASKLKPLLHTWSLSVEEQFYLIWPALIYLIFTSGKKHLLQYIILFFVIISLILNIIFQDGEIYLIHEYFPSIEKYTSNGKSTIFYLLPFRIFEFAIGALIVQASKVKLANNIYYELFYWSGIFLIMASILFFDETMIYPTYYGLAPCIGTALVIYSGAFVKFPFLLINKFTTFTGLISYSLYLIHWPIIVFWLYLKRDNTFSNLEIVILLITTYILASLSYRFVEVPFRKKRAITRLNLWFPLTFCFSTLLILGITLNIQSHKQIIESEVNINNAILTTAEYHRYFYGGSGYPSFGGVKTSGPPDIILIGDSHSKHYAEGLYKEFSEPNGLSLYIAAGTSCIHLPRFTRITPGYNWDILCTESLKNAIDLINKAEKPPIVIVSHSWLSQMSNADILDKDNKPSNIKITSSEIIKGINQLKKNIGDSTLVVIGNVPTTNGENIYDLLSRPTFSKTKRQVKNNLLRTDINPKIYQFNQILQKESKETGSFMFLNPFSFLCNEHSCQNIYQNEHLIYSDSAHLNKFGSRLVIKHFLATLKQLEHERSNL